MTTIESMAQKADKTTAVWVVRRLRKAGFQALLAGGCVRDMLLGVRPDDYDVATDATPRQVHKLFRRSLMVGAKFGVVVVLHRDRRHVDRMIEVATFRCDATYTDGRRPDAVTFSSPEEDAHRRDFTINGMFFDPISEEVIDYVGGQADLKTGVVRTIGDPNERFAEDYLRLLRAVRFTVRLGFRLHPSTANALSTHAKKITRISGERIYDELTKMFSHPSSGRALEAMKKYHLLPHILPELFEPNDETYLKAHQRFGRLPCEDDSLLNFGALLMDLPGEVIGKIARRWGASNQFRNALQWFSRHRDAWRTAADMALSDFKRLMAGEEWQSLRVLWKVREKLEANSRQQAIRIARRAGSIPPEQIFPEPFVTGDDLIRMGAKPGKDMGLLLKALYDAQLNETLTNRKDVLKEAKKRLGLKEE
jgi:poly(A) polymerase